MRVLGFYYGSYMDPDVLRKFGANPEAPRRATLPGWRLAFTPHANMVPGGDGVEGIAYALPHDELDNLYGPNGYVTTYKPVPVVMTLDGESVPALTFVEDAPEAPADPDYVASLRAIMEGVGLPRAYIEAVT